MEAVADTLANRNGYWNEPVTAYAVKNDVIAYGNINKNFLSCFCTLLFFFSFTLVCSLLCIYIYIGVDQVELKPVGSSAPLSVVFVVSLPCRICSIPNSPHLAFMLQQCFTLIIQQSQKLPKHDVRQFFSWQMFIAYLIC